jgi:hypothetical protein
LKTSASLQSQIAQFQSDVDAFSRCISTIPPESFLKKLKNWTIRDIVAHLIGWNWSLIRGSRQIMNGELPFYDHNPGENYSIINAAFIQEYSSTNKDELITELQTSARELARFLSALSPDAWDRDFGVRHKGAVVTIHNSMDELIEDYEHHRKQIETGTT